VVVVGVVAAAVAAAAVAGTVGVAGAATGSAAVPVGCAWSVAALPEVAGAEFGEVRGSDGDRTFVGVSGDRPVRWRDGRLTVLGAAGVAEDVNRRGDAVGGAFSDGEHALLWRGGRQIRLAEPAGFTSSTATAINDAGLIVGYGSGPGEGGGRGLVWRANAPGRVRDLGPGAGALFLRDVSEQGVIVGVEESAGSLQLHAVAGTLRSGLHRLPGTSQDTTTDATAIAGRYVVGADSSGPLRWDRGRPQPLPGGGYPLAVNSRGLAAGIDFAGNETAVLWQHGVRVELPGLTPDGSGGATAVTEHGQVAGAAIGTDQAGTGRSVPAVWTCR
jgi:uncharacterized membrane protein